MAFQFYFKNVNFSDDITSFSFFNQRSICHFAGDRETYYSLVRTSIRGLVIHDGNPNLSILSGRDIYLPISGHRKQILQGREGWNKGSPVFN